MRYALIFQGKVINVIDWNGLTSWSPPEGYETVPSNVADIGDSWDGQKFIKDTSPIVADYYTPAEIATFIDGINSLAKAQAFLRLLVKYLAVKK